MTVTITKPEINLREELSALKSPTGAFGEQLRRAETVTDFYNLKGTNKNVIINGDMRFSQRGDFSAGYSNAAGTPVYTIDRFFNRPYGTDPQTITNNTVTLPDGTNAKSMKVQQTGTTNNCPFYHMIQSIECERWMLGKTFTVSYWYRTNTPKIRGRYCDTLSCYANIGEDMINDDQWHYNAWQMTFSTTATVGTNAQVHPAFTKSDGASILGGEYFEFTLLQMELGTVATPFEFRSNTTELLLCQRFCYAINGTTGGDRIGSGFIYSSTGGIITLPLPVVMRTSPSIYGTPSSITMNDSISGYTQASTVSLNQANPQFIALAFTSSGMTAGRGAQAYFTSSGDNRLVFSAEF
jgi:hypothetical protein